MDRVAEGLRVEGRLPAGLRGTLYRNGPGLLARKGQRYRHWFDGDGLIRRYNRWESEATGLAPARVLAQPLFTAVAQCMNNYLVAQRFEDAVTDDRALDAVVDYVLTWKVRPVPVRLRLLAPAGAPGAAHRYVVIHRLA